MRPPSAIPPASETAAFFGLPHKARERRHKFVAGSSLYSFLRSFSHLVRKLHVSFAVVAQQRGKSKQFAGRRKWLQDGVHRVWRTGVLPRPDAIAEGARSYPCY